MVLAKWLKYLPFDFQMDKFLSGFGFSSVSPAPAAVKSPDSGKSMSNGSATSPKKEAPTKIAGQPAKVWCCCYMYHNYMERDFFQRVQLIFRA